MNWYGNSRTKEAQIMHESTGVIRLEPKLKRLSADTSGWAIIQVDQELTRYYVEQFNFANRARDIQIMKPAWGGHISIMRGENIKDRQLFMSFKNKPVKFSYNPEVKGNDNHFWLEVECPDVEDMREQLGLPRKPYFPFHLTIGVKKG